MFGVSGAVLDGILLHSHQGGGGGGGSGQPGELGQPEDFVCIQR